MTAATGDRDHYAEGWAEGVRHARFLVLQSHDLRTAVERLDDVLIADHRARRVRAEENRRRKGTA